MFRLAAPPSATPSAAGSIDSSASPIASPEPSASTATLAVTPTPSALASVAPIPNGDYVSGVVTCAMWKAIMKDPGVASDEGFQGIMSSCAGVDPSVGGRSTLRLANGRWTQFGQDGSVGDGGPYAFIDGHTVVLQDNNNCPITYDFSLKGDFLKLTPLKAPCGPGSLVVLQVMFGSTLWTRKP